MGTPCCSKGANTDSADFDFSEFPSIIKNEPISKERRSESPAPQRNQKPTECLICGKRAKGYHYYVPSCNGCKTFFRRHCFSENNFICKANRDCFDLTIRAQPIECRACRYQKCISAGMNPMAMHVDKKETSSRNFKKLTKKVKQSNSRDDDDEDFKRELQIERKQVVKNIAPMENKMQKLVDMLSLLEKKVTSFRMSLYNPHWNQLPGLEGFLLMENKISVADKCGPMPGWPLKTQSSPPKDPNFAMPSGPQYSPESKQWFFYDLMVSVEYAKTFLFFHQLEMKDRLILIRYVALELMNLHISYFTVKQKYDSIIHPDGNLAQIRKGMVYAETVMSISPLIRCEIQETEYLLLKAICLCNPVVPDLSQHAQEILGKEREQYAYALFDHCLRNRKEGPSQFAELIGMVELLERQQRMQKDLHLLHAAPFVDKTPQEEKMLLIEDIMNY